MADTELEFTDRYGGNDPDPNTACRGDCEGTGYVPIEVDEQDAEYAARWKAAHDEAGEHSCDGWHFVKCLTCDGTGKRVVG